MDMTLSYELTSLALRTPLAKGRRQWHMTESPASRSSGNTSKNSYYRARKDKPNITTNGTSQSYSNEATWSSCQQRTYDSKTKNYSLGGLDHYEYSNE